MGTVVESVWWLGGQTPSLTHVSDQADCISNSLEPSSTTMMHSGRAVQEIIHCYVTFFPAEGADHGSWIASDQVCSVKVWVLSRN